MLHKIANCCKILFTCAAFISCSNNDKENEKLFKEVNTRLENCNAVLERNIQVYLLKFERDASNPISEEKVSIWYPKVKNVKKISFELIDFINSLKGKIKAKEQVKFSEEDAKELYRNLVKYRTQILTIDKMINNEFENLINTILETQDSVKFSETQFQEYINNSNTSSKLCIYTNKIFQIQEAIIAFCSKQYSTETCAFDNLVPIITQNSKHFKSNEILEVEAGVGGYSGDAIRNISVNNKEIKLQPDGVAIYKKIVPAKPGKYNIIVKLNYFNKFIGKPETKEIKVYYTVDE